MSALQDIKQRNSILDMATDLGLQPIIRAGKATANCPACGDEHGHLYLYLDSNRFHCFKCQRSGDGIDLWAIAKNIALKDAILEVRNRYGDKLATPTRTTQKQPSLEVKQAIKQADIDDQTLSLMYMDTMNLAGGLSAKGKDYLSQRGLTEKTFSRYDIASLDDPNRIKDELLKLHQMEKLMAAGLMDYSSNGKPYFSFFMPAILFPHFDIEITKLTSLTTRNLAGDTKSFKLHNRPAPPFYGNEVKTAKEVFIFEGIINGLSYSEITGDHNFIALGGLITPEAFNQLKSEFPNQKLILGLDPDKSGNDALARINQCTYINWKEFAHELGFNGLQFHANGKAFDLNDYLIMRTK